MSENAFADGWAKLQDQHACPGCSRPTSALELCEHTHPLCGACCYRKHPNRCRTCRGTGQVGDYKATDRGPIAAPGRVLSGTTSTCAHCLGSGASERGDVMTPEAATALRKPFPPESVGKLPKSTCRDCSQSQRKRCDRHNWVNNCPECHGSHTSATLHLDYVGHAATTDRLLTVDPAWTWEPFALTPDGLPAPDREGNLWIRLTVCGVTRIGVGDGKSAKERIGDAIRNAAMRFGVALDLWAKEDLVEFARAIHQNSPAPLAARPQASAEPAPASDPGRASAGEPVLLDTGSKLAKALFAALGDHGITYRQDRLDYCSHVLGRSVESSATLTEADARTLLVELDRLDDTTGADA
ncbi:MAG: hypothetical protein FWE71_17400 [Nocardioidaceae bacterium]|nr:hypothetical protein [Nocardioidaceae bacterium]MCL2611971.1 hypothetical protein [Nocardioidaceae bacterium]